MSLDRAYINCERCYGLAKEVFENLNAQDEHDKLSHGIDDSELIYEDPDTRKKAVYDNDQIYQARNEAMKALDKVARHCFDLHINHGFDLARTHSGVAIEGTGECRDCDYSNPKIAFVIDGKDISDSIPVAGEE